ncbi:MAG: tripartite tricarboxylate transporter TctB family protein [Proteobacteria bacterium]|nr:tripartite tricarboxylate transporter TctB family protein [Pseudomonadota bacterium]MBU1695844.1 tripartite tricarboxylate transporter TctB family protein [Pseudomonadota bacterium]
MLNREAILGIVLTGAGFFLLFYIIPWQIESTGESGALSSAFFPKAGTVLLIILSLIFTITSMKASPKSQSEQSKPMGKKVKLNVFFSALSIALYIAAIALAGFFAATPPMLILLMVILGARYQHWRSVLITVSITTITIYYVLIKMLGLIVP